MDIKQQTKICPVCLRSFSNRKKWDSRGLWDKIVYCSDACKNKTYTLSMKITKLGHCCLLIETKGKRLLTDPGCFTIEAHSKLRDIDAILFTHEHSDHYHLESLKTLLEKNPQARVFVGNAL
jgi:hypothetical protein